MVVMAARAAQTVGQELLKAHQNRHKLDLQVEEKGIDGPVTRVDRYLEQLTIDTLRKSYKNHSFLGEEFGMQEGKGHDADWCWVIDPLDGTQNFVHGVPHFCVSIAVQKNGITEHGVVYDPVRDELFSASRGRGSLMNQRRLQVSERKTIEGGLFTTGHPYECMVGEECVSLLVSILPAYKPSAKMAVRYAVSVRQHLICAMWQQVVMMAILRCH